MKFTLKLKWLAVLLVAAACIVLSPPAKAQPAGWTAPKIKSLSFFSDEVRSVYVTNGIAVTNKSVTAGPSKTGLIYTNNAGRRFVVTDSLYTNVNLLGSVSLPQPPDGRTWVPITNVLAAAAGYLSPATVVVGTTSGSGANAAVTFVFHPKYKSAGIDTATSWTVAFTPTASSSQIFTTNAPLWLWPGASELVWSRVVNADTDASSQVVVTSCTLDYPGSP